MEPIVKQIIQFNENFRQFEDTIASIMDEQIENSNDNDNDNDNINDSIKLLLQSRSILDNMLLHFEKYVKK